MLLVPPKDDGTFEAGGVDEAPSGEGVVDVWADEEEDDAVKEGGYLGFEGGVDGLSVPG